MGSSFSRRSSSKNDAAEFLSAPPPPPPRGMSGLNSMGFDIVDTKKGVKGGGCHRLAVSGMLVTDENFGLYVESGSPYNHVARCCMDQAQAMMQEACNLERVETSRGAVLKSKERHETWLVVVPGKGRVDAGIFSRNLLMKEGLEAGSAMKITSEAVRNGWGLVLLNPNYSCPFDSSYAMLNLRTQWEEVVKPLTAAAAVADPSGPSLKIHFLAHSAGGAQLACMLGDYDSFDWLGKIAFTDSTHSLRQVSTFKSRGLMHYLQSDNARYYRSNDSLFPVSEYPYMTPFTLEDNARSSQESARVRTEQKYWSDRFGNIPTYFCGTAEHARTTWKAEDDIVEFLRT